MNLLQNVALAVFSEPSPEDAAQVCLDEVCRYNHWPAGHLYLRAKDNPNLLKPTAAWYLEDENALAACREIIFSHDLSIGHGLPGRALKSGKPCWTTDLAGDTAPGTGCMADLGITASLAFPVISGREVLGVMSFYARLTEAPHHALIELVNAAATLLGGAIAQHRTAQALRESDTRLAGLLEFAQDAIISMAA
ncbi:MAG: GAF domain-containing protein [SAR324 cluster bacterium]|nr:GAF domain-containing protein [SAR324 cluster bacterium]